MNWMKWAESSGHDENERRFYIQKESADIIKRFIPEKLNIGWCLENLSARQLDILHKWMVFGGGSLRTGGGGRFYTSDVKLADQFQLLCTYTGRRSTIYQRKNDRVGCFKTTKIIAYEIGFTKQCWTIVSEFGKTNYNGVVFDITTKLGNFLVRRNGKPFFTGNCGNHDSSIYRNFGFDVGACIAKQRLDMLFRGYRDATFIIGKTRITLHHGAGSASAARKSNIVLLGHYHTYKQLDQHGAITIQLPAFHALAPAVAGIVLTFQDDPSFLPIVELIEFPRIIEDY
jgi:hypothetical protein